MHRLLSGGGPRVIAILVALAAVGAARVQAAARISRPEAPDPGFTEVHGLAAAELSPLFFLPRVDLTTAETKAGGRTPADFPPVHFYNLRTREHADVRLYDDSGAIDESEAKKLDLLCADDRNPEDVHVVTIDRRTLQLLFRAAYHFRPKQVDIVSGYRSPRVRREGMHGKGRAVDFRFRGVSAAAVARYLRKLPRAGVGLYTHPKTQFVHLDDREQSFHWIDRSPPGHRWHERALSLAGLAERDARYQPADDWPEGFSPRMLVSGL